MPDDYEPSLDELAAEARRRRRRGTVEHDSRCDVQDATLKATAARVDELGRDLHGHEIRVERLTAEMEGLIARIPMNLGGDIATLSGQVAAALRGLDEVKLMLRSDFVTRAELDPVKRLVYGVAGLILTAVVLGVIALVVVTPKPGGVR